MAACAAVIVAVVAVGLIVLGSGTSYTVSAMFQNASQIVAGDLVEVAGSQIGTVSGISLAPDSEAKLTLNITDSAYIPLHLGTRATVREVSLSGVANRYVNLDVGPSTAPTIRAGGTITESQTTSEVDLDQLFNTLDPSTRRGLQQLIQGTATQYKGYGPAAAAAFQYLNPAIASSSLLFAELNRDTGKFTDFITKSGHLVTDIASRQADLSSLIRNLARTTEALAAQHVALGQSIQDLPGFMRLADTTFVNLRTALRDLTPLVNASKPVAPKLNRLLLELRPLAQDSVPTVRDLANIISRPGANNDLIELTKLGVPLAAVTVHKVRANGKLRDGAFTASTIALTRATPELAFARPYATDLTGWFEGFSHPGGYDANGAFSRVAPVVGVASLDSGVLTPLASLLNPALRAITAFGSSSKGGPVTTGQGDRCPGSMERGAIYYPESGYACTPTQVPTGP